MARNCAKPVYVDGLGGSEACEGNPDTLLFPNVPHDPPAMLPLGSILEEFLAAVQVRGQFCKKL
jgi:hypothetical protein